MEFPPGAVRMQLMELWLGRNPPPREPGKGKEDKSRNSGNVLLLTFMETLPQNSAQAPTNTRPEGAFADPSSSTTT